jgi:hypothetical protein
VAVLTPSNKRLAIAIIVVGSALIAERVYSLASDDTAVGLASEPQRTARAPAPDHRQDGERGATTDLRLNRLEARQLALSEGSEPQARPAGSLPFDSVSWLPPAPKPPPLPPPPRPVAPPFAYAYMGGLTEDGVRTAFFTKGDRVIVVKEGDTIDAAYHVDKMTNTFMKLTYLPLNEAVEVALGSGR